jgi:hypothetical protein
MPTHLRRVVRLLLSAAVLITAAAARAGAQVPTVPHFIGEERYSYTGTSPVAILTSHQTSGDWFQVQRYALELLQTLAKDAKVGPLLGNVSENYYNIVWLSPGADGKDAINRVLVHAGLSPQHAARLPGLESHWPPPPNTTAAAPDLPDKVAFIDENGPELLDVLLTDARSARLASAYVFTPTANPLLTQLPDVVSKVNPLGFLAAQAGTGNVASSMLVSVNQVDLAFGRATIQIKDAVTTFVTPAALLAEADETRTSLKLRQARTSVCAQRIADALRDSIASTLTDAKCKPSNDPPTLQSCAKAVKSGLDTAFAKAVEAEASCRTQPPAGGVDPLAAVEDAFKGLVANGGAKVVNGTATLTNTPLTRLSFGLMGGLLIGHPTLKAPRVKVDSGKIVNAPMEHTLSMVVLNIHPSPYDAEWPEVTWSERFRFFAGAVLTPDFGVTAGAGVGLVRGLSVNAGVAFMASNRLKDQEAVGQAPVNANDPFRYQLATAGFIGVGYAFK